MGLVRLFSKEQRAAAVAAYLGCGRSVVKARSLLLVHPLFSDGIPGKSTLFNWASQVAGALAPSILAGTDSTLANQKPFVLTPGIRLEVAQMALTVLKLAIERVQEDMPNTKGRDAAVIAGVLTGIALDLTEGRKPINIQQNNTNQEQRNLVLVGDDIVEQVVSRINGHADCGQT